MINLKNNKSLKVRYVPVPVSQYLWDINSKSKKVFRIFFDWDNRMKDKKHFEISKIDFQICYQSKVGPLRWTTPSLGDEIKRIAKDNKNPLIIPIAFVSDHSETLVELDIEYKHLANELGIKNYYRVPALNLDGNFIQALKTLCINVNSNDQDGYFYEDKNLRFCPKKYRYCQNKNSCKD
jgi:hypothetical protein